MNTKKILPIVFILSMLGLAAAMFLESDDSEPDDGGTSAEATRSDATRSETAAEDATPVANVSGEAPADPDVGAPAPDFTLEGTDGQTYTLSDLQGEYVVLEWLNFGCPYVQKHYGSGNMQALQEKYTEKGVKWLSVVSSAPGKQGHYPPAEMNAKNEAQGGQQTAILMDPSGEVGQQYGAQTTPHMYIINPEGELIYKGGIDDRPTTDEADVEGATNYVSQALDAAMSGEEVPTKKARPYGCSVKYAS